MMKLTKESNAYISSRITQLVAQFEDVLKDESFQLQYWRTYEKGALGLPTDHSRWLVSDEQYLVLKESGFVDLSLILLADLLDWLRITEQHQYQSFISNRGKLLLKFKGRHKGTYKEIDISGASVNVSFTIDFGLNDSTLAERAALYKQDPDRWQPITISKMKEAWDEACSKINK